jgi:GNAT superfamily N-acetyltransferase
VADPEIRPAVPEDVPRITEVFQAARAAAMPWLPVLHTPDEDLAFFGRLVAEHVAHVAVLEHRVVAFAVVDEGAGDLEHLYVDPDMRRRGLGSALVRRVRAERQGALQLWAFRDNTAARAFYAALGAVELYETDGSGNEERTPDVRLELPALVPPSAGSRSLDEGQ